MEKAADWTLQRAAKNTLREALRYVTAEQEAGDGSGRVDGGWVFRRMMEQVGASPNHYFRGFIHSKNPCIQPYSSNRVKPGVLSLAYNYRQPTPILEGGEVVEIDTSGGWIPR